MRVVHVKMVTLIVNVNVGNVPEKNLKMKTLKQMKRNRRRKQSLKKKVMLELKHSPRQLRIILMVKPNRMKYLPKHMQNLIKTSMNAQLLSLPLLRSCRRNLKAMLQAWMIPMFLKWLKNTTKETKLMLKSIHL